MQYKCKQRSSRKCGGFDMILEVRRPSVFVPMPEYNIEIPNEASMHVLRNFLTRNNFFPEDATGFDLNFHPRFVYLQPFALAMLAAWGHHWTSRGVPIRCRGLTAAGIDYAWRMRLFELLHVDHQHQRAEHEEAGRFIPLRTIGTGADVAGFLADVAPLLHRPEHVQAVQYCLSETIRNVLEHAGGAPAFACAQFYPTANRVSIGVADCGIGVQNSLARYHNFATSGEALLGALRPGVTGAVRGAYGPPDNAGVGLFFTKSIAKASHEYFGIISGTAAYRLRRVRNAEQFRLYVDPREDRHDLYGGLPPWKGTVVAVDIGVRRIRSFEATMAAIRTAIAPQHREGDRPKVRFR